MDDWGEPGSMLRNPRISEIFHDTNLAETKGTGIGAMRRLMKEAGLMPPTFESNHEANKFTARLLLHHFLSKENMEWLALYASFDLTNEQKLALVFVREVGTIDNATYRQLDSSITHARARLEIHKLCDLGFLEKKGQGRNTYYIRTSKVVSLEERLRPQDERILPQHGTLGERYQGEVGTFEEECMLKPREELVRELPNELQEKVNNIGSRASRETVYQLIIDLCAFKPYSYEELASVLQRSPKALKDKYLKPLRLANKLFYWIPEMINHPLQKYVADPLMARSNTKKK